MNELNQCIICLEEINKSQCLSNQFKFNCICKYNIHTNCLNKWLSKKRKCIICKEPIEIKQSLMMRSIIIISKPFLQLMFIPLLIIYFVVLNAAYGLNIMFSNPYVNEGR